MRVSSYISPFGIACRELRDSKQLSMEDMALVVGYSKAFLSTVECGKTTIPTSYPYKIIKLLQLNTKEATDLLVSVAVTSSSLNLAHIENKDHIETVSRLVCSINTLSAKDIDAINSIINQS